MLSEHKKRVPSAHIIGYSQRMGEVFELVKRAARNDTATVLITGESGTGKEVVARAIHDQSTRASGPFHPLNCAAIANNLVESELFGHEREAFTGAKNRKPGLLELANGGTLFLDEIGEMSLDMQAKLLRVLETRSFFRLGGVKEVKIDVRVLAATNRNLEQAIEEGTFRADLYYRLAVLKIVLPPLRERPDDISLFADHFVKEFNKSLGRNVGRIAPEMQQLLRAHPWPGNVRELKNVIEHAMILSSGDELLPVHFPREVIRQSTMQETALIDPWERWLSMRPTGPVALEELISRIKQDCIRWALTTAEDNRTQAAKLLGYAKVEQLRYLIRKYDIE